VGAADPITRTRTPVGEQRRFAGRLSKGPHPVRVDQAADPWTPRPHRQRRRHRLRTWAGPVVLTLVLAGVPAAELWAGRGGPWRVLAGAVVHPDRLLDGATHPVSADVVVAALLSLVAVGWLWLVACVAVELVCRWRGRPRWVLPGSARLQQAIGVLLGGALAVAPVAKLPVARPTGVAVGGSARSTATAVVHTAQPPATSLVQAEPSDCGAPANPAARPAGGWRTYVVQPGDTLWSIAATQLGSPLQWRALAAANQGRPQPNGGRLVDDNWILPGWTLLLPPRSPAGPSQRGTETSETAPDNAADAATAAALAGETALPSPTPAATGAAPGHPQGPVRGHSRSAERPSQPGANPDRVDRQASRPPTTPEHGAGIGDLVCFGLLAASVVLLVDRLRRAQQRHRPTGWRIALPPADAAALEVRLRRTADNRAADRIAAGYGELHRISQAAHLPCPPVAALRVRNDTVEILTTPGWSTPSHPLGAAGRRPGWWQLPTPPGARSSARPRPSVADRLVDGTVPPAAAAPRPASRSVVPVPPTVVTIGRTADAVVAVDLAVVGALAIDHPRADAICHALAVELATLPTAETVELVLVGFSPAFQIFDRVRQVDGERDLLALVEDRVLEVLTDSVQRGLGSPTGPDDDRGGADRWVAAGDPAAPNRSSEPEVREQLVVLCAAGADLSPAATTELHRLVSVSDGAVALVTAGAGSALPWQVVGSGDGDVELRWPHAELDGAGGAGTAPGATPTQPGGGLASSPVCDRQPLAAVQELPGTAVDQISAIVRVAAGRDAVFASPAGGQRPERRHDGADTGLGAHRSGPVTGDTGPAGGSNQPARPGVWCAGLELADTPTGRPATAERPSDSTEEEPGTALPPAGVGRVLVRVLGPVAIEGAERPFSRAWTQDLVVYLALHPAGASTDQWSTALWPDRVMAPASLHSTASAARRALGTDTAGRDHLPRAHGRLQLAPTVETDWQAFEALAGTDDPERWRQALELVRGRPLDGLRAIDWAILEGLLPSIEATVVDTAERRGQWCLGRGDASGAEWAARRGLVVSPYDERLYRILLRAADLAGNPAGVEAVMAELVRLVAEDVEPFDAVHPETLALYRSLTRRPARPGRR
jgi:hypothetical protein